MGGGNQEVVKFFVTNLPEGCTPWELRQGLEHYGVISGTYVAKKRDKMGNRFGFVSFVESHGLDVRVSHANIGNTQDEREKGGCGVSVDNEVSPRNLDCRSNVSNSVGPNDTQTDVGPLPNPFNMGLGDRSLRSNVKFSLGSRLRKTCSQPTKDSSPVEVRPVKRPRPVSEAYEPGFGFIGFTNSAA
ncbi:putative RNA recognition motif domain, nucleotide-binding alpha-beta plait domain superfamily [Helianthus annuus]|nr:putative RNA recognition motif domain, nucleotide-binding alpha-beta plait domain superfamily [Helianthus annuus]